MEEIKPLVEEAKQAVGNIKANTLSEIRSLRAPPGKNFKRHFIKLKIRVPRSKEY
jgi:hypothetical protein